MPENTPEPTPQYDEPGVCPACKGMNLDYGPVVIDGGSASYPWKCPDCGKTGREIYSLEFVEHEMSEKK